MLAEIEDGLVALIKASPLAQRLAIVATLPEPDGETLIKRLAADAPGVFVSVANFPVSNSAATLKVGLVCVAKNVRGHDAARKGDGKIIGLYQIMEAVASLLDNACLSGITWRVDSGDFMAEEKLYQAGLHVGVIRIETTGPITLGAALDETTLADFETLHTDYDIPPQVSSAEHIKWLTEPPDHTGSAPELSDQLNLQ